MVCSLYRLNDTGAHPAKIGVSKEIAADRSAHKLPRAINRQSVPSEMPSPGMAASTRSVTTRNALEGVIQDGRADAEQP